MSQARLPKLKDHELMLWLFISGHGRWEPIPQELVFGGRRYCCSLDLVGLPELDDETRKELRDFYKRITTGQLESVMPIREVQEVEITCDVWVFRDSRGTLAGAVRPIVSQDPITVAGLVGPRGEHIQFEDAAYHLRDWCRENAIECTHSTRKFTEFI